MLNIRIPHRPGLRVRGPQAVDIVIVLALVGLIYALAQAASLWSAPLASHATIDLGWPALPGYALASLVRMTAAYLLSMAFSLTYGRLTASGRGLSACCCPSSTSCRASQSCRSCPAWCLPWSACSGGNNAGLELAAIVLIFTSQAWNLAFSFYQSMRTIPADLREAATVARLTAGGASPNSSCRLPPSGSSGIR
jgi:NitT/TauT family transport system permease protein